MAPMRKTTLFLSLFLFLSLAAMAQVPKVGLAPIFGGGWKYGLKASLNTSYDMRSGFNTRFTHSLRTRTFRVSPPTASLLIYSKGRSYSELEMVVDVYSRLELFRDLNSPLTTGAVSANYVIGPAFSYYFGMGNSAGKTTWLLGFRNALVAKHSRVRPFESNEFPQSITGMELHLELVPGLRFDWTDRLFSDFLVPLRYAELSYQTERIDDPSVALRLRSIQTFNFRNRLLERFQVRMSIGVNI